MELGEFVWSTKGPENQPLFRLIGALVDPPLFG
jgi:hypothetical protein